MEPAAGPDSGLVRREPVHAGSGTFRVDRARALAVLRRYQLPEPSDFLLPWLRLAVASGAREARLKRLAWGLELRFGGEPLPAERLKNPLDCLFSEEEGAGEARFPHLLAGMQAALRFAPWRLVLCSGAGARRARLAIAPDGQERFSAGEPGEDTVLQVVWRGWFTGRLTHRCLERARSAAALLPIPLLIDGEPAASGGDGEGFLEDGVRGRIVFSRGLLESSIRFCKYGVAAARLPHRSSSPRFRADVNDDRLRLTASQSGILRDASFSRVLEIVDLQARRLARSAP